MAERRVEFVVCSIT